VTHCCDFSPPHVRAIAPYLPGKPISELAREMGLSEADIVKLASNENPLGPSPRARGGAGRPGRHGAVSGWRRLRAEGASCRPFGHRHRQIVLGNGSNDVLDWWRARSSRRARRRSFAACLRGLSARDPGHGAQRHRSRRGTYGHDLAAMRAAIRDDTRVVFIANPNNPTGTFLPWAEIEAFLDTVPRGAGGAGRGLRRIPRSRRRPLRHLAGVERFPIC
jgi:histidinol-phosphate aminotransferase